MRSAVCISVSRQGSKLAHVLAITSDVHQGYISTAIAAQQFQPQLHQLVLVWAGVKASCRARGADLFDGIQHGALV